jgi:hypothetical protein
MMGWHLSSFVNSMTLSPGRPFGSGFLFSIKPVAFPDGVAVVHQYRPDSVPFTGERVIRLARTVLGALGEF